MFFLWGNYFCSHCGLEREAARHLSIHAVRGGGLWLEAKTMIGAECVHKNKGLYMMAIKNAKWVTWALTYSHVRSSLLQPHWGTTAVIYNTSIQFSYAHKTKQCCLGILFFFFLTKMSLQYFFLKISDFQSCAESCQSNSTEELISANPYLLTGSSRKGIVAV